MQTRPFFKNLAAKVTAFGQLFRTKQTIATLQPTEPPVHHNKSSGGSHRNWRNRRIVMRVMVKSAILAERARPMTNPKFMHRGARVRMGLQPSKPTWH